MHEAACLTTIYFSVVFVSSTVEAACLDVLWCVFICELSSKTRAFFRSTSASTQM